MPLSAEDTKVADELSRVVTMGREIIKGISDKGPFSTIKVSRFLTSTEHILERGFGTGSVFYKRYSDSCNIEFPQNYNKNQIYDKTIRVQIGILLAALDAINRGLTKELFYEKEIIVFSNLLDQAYEFLESQNTYLAAGVYGRIVLETAIKEFAKLKLNENYNSEMKFDQIIIKLRKEGYIQEIIENRLRDYYKIGSQAAHNNKEFTNYSKKDLKDFLTFIKDNVLILK